MDKETLQLIRQISYLNPDAGEIGAGMLRNLVERAKSILNRLDNVPGDLNGNTAMRPVGEQKSR